MGREAVFRLQSWRADIFSGGKDEEQRVMNKPFPPGPKPHGLNGSKPS